MSEGKKRKFHTPEFKAKVALEALRGIKTLNEIGQEFGVHPITVGHWKKELQEQAKTLFEGKRGPTPISKRGDVYLRKLLIHGARSAIQHTRSRSPWVEKMLLRRPVNVVVSALANKMARTIWALLAHDKIYEKDYARNVA